MKCVLFIFIGFLSSCTTYYLTTDSLAKQLNENKKFEGPSRYFTLITYTSNNLDKIKCTSKNGREFWVTIDGGSRIVLVKKAGTKVFGRFDTTVLRGDTLYTIESRISSGRNFTLLKDIDRIEIKRTYIETKNNLPGSN